MMTDAELTTSSEMRNRNKLKSISRGTFSKQLEKETGPGKNSNETDTVAKDYKQSAEALLLDHNRREESSDEEALRLLKAVSVALRKDDSSRRYNKTTRIMQTCLSALGIVCLVWPSLLLFDSLLFLMPFDHIEALEYTSQEISLVGSASRLCLKVVKLAESARMTNKETHGISMLGCFGFLTFLLFLVRRTSMRRAVMTRMQRYELMLLKKELGETLESRRRSLLESLQMRRRERNKPTQTIFG